MKYNDYVSFRTAKLLKAAGYPQDDCVPTYDKDGVLFARLGEIEDEGYAAPHLYDAIKWLRVERDYWMSICPSRTMKLWELRVLSTNKADKGCLVWHNMRKKSYEEACEEGIAETSEWIARHPEFERLRAKSRKSAD